MPYTNRNRIISPLHWLLKELIAQNDIKQRLTVKVKRTKNGYRARKTTVEEFEIGSQLTINSIIYGFREQEEQNLEPDYTMKPFNYLKLRGGPGESLPIKQKVILIKTINDLEPDQYINHLRLRNILPSVIMYDSTTKLYQHIYILKWSVPIETAEQINRILNITTGLTYMLSGQLIHNHWQSEIHLGHEIKHKSKRKFDLTELGKMIKPFEYQKQYIPVHKTIDSMDLKPNKPKRKTNIAKETEDHLQTLAKHQSKITSTLIKTIILTSNQNARTLAKELNVSGSYVYQVRKLKDENKWEASKDETISLLQELRTQSSQQKAF